MRRSPLRAKPPKRAEPIPREVRDAVRARAGGRCEVRARGCDWYDWPQIHHRWPQQYGEAHTEANCLLVCWACHQRIHAHPDWAYGRGLLIHRHDGPPSESWVNVDTSPREW